MKDPLDLKNIFIGVQSANYLSASIHSTQKSIIPAAMWNRPVSIHYMCMSWIIHTLCRIFESYNWTRTKTMAWCLALVKFSFRQEDRIIFSSNSRIDPKDGIRTLKTLIAILTLWSQSGPLGGIGCILWRILGVAVSGALGSRLSALQQPPPTPTPVPGRHWP